MLKLNYTAMGLHMERISLSLEEMISRRTRLAVRVGQSFHFEPGTATFLLPADMPILSQLETMLWIENNDCITTYPVDVDFVEVGLRGIWMAESPNAHEGTFLATATPQVEFLIYQLWQAGQVCTSSLA